MVEEGPAVYQHQCAPGPLRDQPDRGHRLADARRRDQDSNVMSQQRANRLLLKPGKSASKTVLDGLSGRALIIDLEGRSQVSEKTTASSMHPRGNATCWGKPSAQATMRGVSAVDSRMPWRW